MTPIRAALILAVIAAVMAPLTAHETVAQTPTKSLSGSVVVAPADTTSAPYTQFANFLSLAVATRVPHIGSLDSVYTCDMEEGRMDMRWVATYHILSVTTHADSGRAAAVITSVARQTDKGYGWTASYGVRDDTAHWALTRGTETGGRWMVCGDAFEGFGVWHIGRTVTWLTGSKAEALAAVDSIRRARGLALVR